MLAFPLNPVDPMLASTSTYLPHSALHLAAPPIAGPSECFPSSSVWSALSFYESVPRAISPAPSTSRASDYDSLVASTPRWNPLNAHGSDETHRLLSSFGPRRAPSPFPGRGNGGVNHASSGPQRDPTSARPASASQSSRRSVSPPTPDVLYSTPQRANRTERAGSIPDLSRVQLSDPEPAEDELDFERKFVPLAPLRKKAKARARRGPYARSAADLQRLVPPFG